MIQSPELDQLFVALAEFQSRVGAIPKNAANPFFKSKYAALPDVVAVASPILTECGLCVSQHLGHDEQGDTLTTIVGHKSGQFMGDTMHLRPVKDDPQAQGSATSYGRRYSYMAVLGLVADEDDDGNAGSAGTRKPARVQKPAKAAPVTAKASGTYPTANPGADRRGETITKIRAAFEQSGKSADWLSLKLIEITGRDSSPATLRADIPALSSDEALLLLAALSFDGSQLDDGTPGSGETAA